MPGRHLCRLPPSDPFAPPSMGSWRCSHRRWWGNGNGGPHRCDLRAERLCVLFDNTHSPRAWSADFCLCQVHHRCERVLTSAARRSLRRERRSPETSRRLCARPLHPGHRQGPDAFRNRHRDLLEQSRAPDHQRRRRCPRTNGAPWHHSQDGVGSGNFGGQMWVGAAGNGVTGVRIHLNNHTTVTAAVGAGYFAAWWPSQTNIADQIGQPRRPVKRADSPRNTPGTDSLGGTLGFWSPPRLSWL